MVLRASFLVQTSDGRPMPNDAGWGQQLAHSDEPARITIHGPTLTPGLHIQGTLGTPMGDFGRFSCLASHENLAKSPIGVPNVSLQIHTAYEATGVTKIWAWDE